MRSPTTTCSPPIGGSPSANPSAPAASPPPRGRPPAPPAPPLPGAAIAYEDLLSPDRRFPFDNTCDQVTAGTLDELGARGARVIDLSGRPEGCAIEFGTAEFDQ